MPGPGVALQAGLAGLLVGVGGAVLASKLRARGTAVPYTRKAFHLVIFTAAGVVHGLWGLPGTNTYGVVVATLVLLAVARGDGDPFYEALARETDRPRRSLFIVLPLATTAAGGLASALLAGPLAAVGYLVAGWGDAVGEPVGRRWGRHPYRVPSLAGVAAERTLEGSSAVFVVSWVAAVLALLGHGSPSEAVWVGLACAAAATLLEAFSHHGLDNLTVQVGASLTAVWLIG